MNLELQDLIDRYLNGTLSDADGKLLSERLRSDPEARSAFVKATHLDSALRDYAAAEATVSGEDSGAWLAQEGLDKVTVGEVEKRPVSIGRFAKVTLPIAAAIVVGCIAYFAGKTQIADPNGVADTTEGATAVAMLATVLDAEWSESTAWSEGDLVQGGDTISLSSGSVELSFFSGASVVLEGESQLRVVDEAGAVFDYGRLRADVPPSASGFEIVTSEMKLIDIGTEFGLDLPRDGDAQVHVIEGEVQVFPEGDNKRWDLVTGQSLTGGQLGDAEPDRFLSAIDLVAKSQSRVEEKFLRWQRKRDLVANDRDVVVYFPFDEKTFDGRRVQNAALHGPDGTHGILIGGEKLPGRWPGKESIAFMNGADRIRIHVPGEFESLSMSAWIQIPFGGFDTAINGLLLTDGYEHAECHWQLSRGHDLFFSVQGGFDPVAEEDVQKWNQRNRTEDQPLAGFRPGTWHLLSVTYDGDTGRVTHYVDGDLVFSQVSPLQRDVLKLKIGAASIGNWGTPLPHGNYPTQVRNLNTRLDEFTIWKRTLTPGEVADLYQEGRPFVQ